MSDQVKHNAALAVERLQGKAPGNWDYTPASLHVVDAVLDALSPLRSQIAPETFEALINIVGCYVLEVGSREHGGNVVYFEPGKHLVLVVGEPEFHVSISPFDVVRNRLNGSPLHSTAIIYGAFSKSVRNAAPRTSAVFGFFPDGVPG